MLKNLVNVLTLLIAITAVQNEKFLLGGAPAIVYFNGSPWLQALILVGFLGQPIGKTSEFMK